MRLRRWCLLLLVASAFLLGGCTASSSHSLRFFYTTTWDSDMNLFRFFAVEYFDDWVGVSYNSDTKIATPWLFWLKTLQKDDSDFWNRNTGIIQGSELRMKKDMRNLLNQYNQSGGLHTWQNMNGCELGEDGRKSGFSQYAYDGEDFLIFDTETLTWTAVMEPAKVIKKLWEADPIRSKSLKSYLEEECVDRLRKFLDYGKDSLSRRELPMVTVARKRSCDGLDTLVCRAHGFHPKEIDATWRKEGLVCEQETFRGGVIPNSDGTYHTWANVTIDPKDWDRYRCHVEHDSLPESLDLAWEQPALSKERIILAFVTVTATGSLLALIFMRFCTGRTLRMAIRTALVIIAIVDSIFVVLLSEEVKKKEERLVQCNGRWEESLIKVACILARLILFMAVLPLGVLLIYFWLARRTYQRAHKVSPSVPEDSSFCTTLKSS